MWITSTCVDLSRRRAKIGGVEPGGPGLELDPKKSICAAVMIQNWVPSAFR